MSNATFFDACAGIGGFHLGLSRIGMQCVGFSEIDKYAEQTYLKNFPGTKNYGDIARINPKELPDFELFCGGFPCQPFSVAGKQRGFDDPRGNIFLEIARIVKEKQPRILLLENVKGLLSHDKGKTFRTIRNTLNEMGYAVEWQLFNSKYFVPQNRERIFIVGYLGGERPRKIFPIREANEVDAKINQGQKKQLPHITNCIDASYYKGIDKHGQRTMIAIPVMAPDRKNKHQNGRIIKEEGDPMFTLTSQDKHGILLKPLIVADRSRNLANLGRSLESPKEISNSLTSATKDNLLFENCKIRRLTPKECERLQTFPDNWTDSVSDTQRYRQTGNAVTVDVVEYIARMLDIN